MDSDSGFVTITSFRVPVMAHQLELRYKIFGRFSSGLFPPICALAYRRNSAQHILKLMLNVRCAILPPNPGLPAPIAFMQSPQSVHRMQSGPCSTQTTPSFGVSHRRANVFQPSSVKGSPLKRDNRIHRPSVSCTVESAAVEMDSAEVCPRWCRSRSSVALLVGSP